jgi:hypothetical protein
VNLGRERIADPGHGPDQPLDAGLVADRLADLRDDLGEARVADVGLRPQRVAQLPLGDGSRPAFEQHHQQAQAARRQGHGLPAPAQLERVGIERAIGEDEAHRPDGS